MDDRIILFFCYSGLVLAAGTWGLLAAALWKYLEL